MWTRGVDRVITVPIAHGEGRYVCDDETLKSLQDGGQIAFLYVDEAGEATKEANPNGSVANIAGIVNQRGNVLGMMPHPERYTSELLGSTDGLLVLGALNLVSAS